MASLSPIGTDLETVKQQIEELKVWVGAEKFIKRCTFKFLIRGMLYANLFYIIEVLHFDYGTGLI